MFTKTKRVFGGRCPRSFGGSKCWVWSKSVPRMYLSNKFGGDRMCQKATQQLGVWVDLAERLQLFKPWIRCQLAIQWVEILWFQ